MARLVSADRLVRRQIRSNCASKFPPFRTRREAGLRRAAAAAISLMSLAKAVQSAHADTYGFFGATETLPGYGAHPTGMYSGTNGAPPVFAYNLSGSFTDASAWDDYNEAYSPTTGLFALQAPGAGDTVTIGGLPAGWETPTEGPTTTDSSGDPVYGYYGLTEAGYDGGNGFQVIGASGTIANLGVGGPGNLTLGSLNVTANTMIESIGAIPLIEFTADGGFTTTGVVGSVLTVSGGSLSTPQLTLCAATDLSVEGADPVADAGSLIFSGTTISGDRTQVVGVLPQSGTPNDAYNAQPVEFDDSTLKAKTELDIVGVDPSLNPNATGTTTLIADDTAIEAGAVVIGTGTLGFGSGSPFCPAVLTLTDSSTLTATATGDSPSSLIVGDTGDGTLTAEEGSQINTQQSVIGNTDFSTGNVIIDASTWNNSSFLTIGNEGAGTLTVTDGGTVTTSDILYVGNQDGGAGTLIIDAGSTVTADTTGIDGTNSVSVGTDAGSAGTITIDGQGSQLESMGDMAIGYNGDGFVLITNGASLLVDGDIFRVGRNEGSNGTLTVTGAGSNVNGPNTTMYVGYGGAGTVNIEDGGSISVMATSIGGQEDGTGVVNIDGTGTQANLGTLTVGDGGEGTLNVTGGASLSASSITIGNAFGDAGTMFVDGATTGVMTDDDVIVGNAAPGALTMVDGATLRSNQGLIVGSQDTGIGVLLLETGSTLTTTDDATIGEEQGSMGTVGVDGTGTKLTINGDFTLGAGGAGVLTILDNSTLSNQAAIVGRDEESDGFALVSGTGSTWQSTGAMTIGQSGTGEVIVNEGAILQVGGDLTIGQNEDSDGSLTIDGASTQFTYTGGDISVGSSGNGALTIQNAAFLDLTGVDTTLGSEVDGDGILTVTDPDTMLNTSGLTVGGQGNGQLFVQNGGALSSGDSTIGDMEGSTGTATVTDAGSTWTASNLTVGGGGAGTLLIENGGVVTVNGTELDIGDESTGDGTIVLSGAGSQLNFTGNLEVGENGFGLLAVQGGASFTGKTINIGDMMDGFGAMTIDGTGTTVEVQSAFNIGEQGSGLLKLTNSAALTADGNATIGDMPNSFGTASINSLSTWNVGGTLTVGGQSAGTLGVAGGGTVSANAMTIGDQSTGAGTVTLTGPATLQITGSPGAGSAALVVGNQGAGTLIMSGGASLSATSVSLGGLPTGANVIKGGAGTLTVTGSNTAMTVTGDLQVGSFNLQNDQYGFGSLEIAAGATVTNQNAVVEGTTNGSAVYPTVVVYVTGSDSNGHASFWHTKGHLTVGLDGMAVVRMDNGAVATVDDNLIAGQNTDPDPVLNYGGSSGLIFLTGLGTTFNVAGSATLGVSGSGGLSVNDQANANFSSPIVTLGQNSTGYGHIDVGDPYTSEDRSLVDLNALVVGDAGTGAVSIDSGAKLISHASYMTVGNQQGSIGSVTVEGEFSNLTLNSGATFTAGLSGNGTLSVMNSASIDLGNIVAGGNSTGIGTIDVAGAGTAGTSSQVSTNGITTGGGTMGTATLLFDDGLIVGNNGAGTLSITAGGQVTPSGTGTGLVSVGALSGGNGTVMVDGSASHFEATALLLAAPGAQANFNLTNGATAHVATSVQTGVSSFISVTGGGFTIGADSPLAAGGSIQVNPGGVLGGQATITGNVVNAGAVAPTGQLGMFISGNYTQSSGGVLAFEIAGANSGEFSTLQTGSISVGSGSVMELVFINGFTPLVGNTFQVITSSAIDPVNNTFSDLQVQGLPADYQFTVSEDSTGFEVETIAAPEPSVWPLLVFGVSAVACRRSRGKSGCENTPVKFASPR
jgi:fibronectin-binding autotransporter adhesin